MLKAVSRFDLLRTPDIVLLRNQSYIRGESVVSYRFA